MCSIPSISNQHRNKEHYKPTERGKVVGLERGGALRFWSRTCGLSEVDSESLVPAHTSSSIFSVKSICGWEDVEQERVEDDRDDCGDSVGVLNR